MRLKEYVTESDFNLSTKKDQTGHVHECVVNADGDGKTVSGDHEHRIFEWMVQPSHGHVHNLEDII